MKAFWRGESAGIEKTRFSLFEMKAGKACKLDLPSYLSGDSSKAEQASEPIAEAIEAQARALGYAIIENPID